MIKCLFCPATFEMKPIEIPFDLAKRKEAEDAQRAQAAEGEKWEHVQVVVTRDGGKLELLAGHLCPAEQLQPDSIKLAKV